MERKNTHIPYAVVTALVMIVVGVILKVMHLEYQSGMQWIGFIPFLAGIILNATAFSKANDGFVSFGQVFGSGFKATAIITLILIVWSFVSLAIWPDTVDIAIQKAEADMLKKGMPEDQVSMSLEMTRKYFKVFMVAGVLFGMLFFGAIFSLLGAAIAKKKGSASPTAMQ